MARKPKKHYSAAEKLRILKKHLVDRIPVSDVCDQYQVTPSAFYRWQQQLFENGEAALERAQPKKQTSAEAQKIRDLEQRLTHKDHIIAEITQEFVLAKKKNGDH